MLAVETWLRVASSHVLPKSLLSQAFLCIYIYYRNSEVTSDLTYGQDSHPGVRSQVGLGRITTNKASGGDGIPVELFQILKDDAVKVLHSICQRIWKTQQWPRDWKRSVSILIPKKGNAKECSNYHTIALISHASKVILKVLQARL